MLSGGGFKRQDVRVKTKFIPTKGIPLESLLRTT
jgi:hypothetical protein